MAFSQSSITEVHKPVQSGGRLYLRWESSAPAGTWFQVYVGRRLTWWGQARRAEIPVPPSGLRTRIDIGTVLPSEFQDDFSGSLPAASSARARLAWKGGTYQDEGRTIQGFNVYGESMPGAGIDYTRRLAFVPAYEDGQILDGFGLGGFGDGGFGYAASDYSWTSGELCSGTWNYAVKTIDAAGNEGPALATSVSITTPPMPPDRFTDGTRLHYSYDAGDQEITLSWLPSPG